MMMEAASTFVTYINFYKTSQWNTPEDSHVLKNIFFCIHTWQFFAFRSCNVFSLDFLVLIFVTSHWSMLDSFDSNWSKEHTLQVWQKPPSISCIQGMFEVTITSDPWWWGQRMLFKHWFLLTSWCS
jgi:hypothetical protein